MIIPLLFCSTLSLLHAPARFNPAPHTVHHAARFNPEPTMQILAEDYFDEDGGAPAGLSVVTAQAAVSRPRLANARAHPRGL